MTPRNGCSICSGQRNSVKLLPSVKQLRLNTINYGLDGAGRNFAVQLPWEQNAIMRKANIGGLKPPKLVP